MVGEDCGGTAKAGRNAAGVDRASAVGLRVSVRVASVGMSIRGAGRLGQDADSIGAGRWNGKGMSSCAKDGAGPPCATQRRRVG